MMDKSEYPNQGSKEYESVEYHNKNTATFISKRYTYTTSVSAPYDQEE